MAKIDFMGDPAKGESFSKLTNLLSRVDTKSTLLATAFTATAYQITDPTQTPVSTATCLAANIFGALFMRYTLERNRISETFLNNEDKKYCINTQPDKNQPDNIDKWETSVSGLKNRYFLWSAATIVCAAVILSLSLSTKHPANTCLQLLGNLSLITRCISGAQRWHKVSTGEWRIEDNSGKKERVPVREKVGAFFKKPTLATDPS